MNIDQDDPRICKFCNKIYKTEKVQQMHYKKMHEKMVTKLEKKLNKKAKSLYK